MITVNGNAETLLTAFQRAKRSYATHLLIYKISCNQRPGVITFFDHAIAINWERKKEAKAKLRDVFEKISHEMRILKLDRVPFYDAYDLSKDFHEAQIRYAELPEEIKDFINAEKKAFVFENISFWKRMQYRLDQFMRPFR